MIVLKDYYIGLFLGILLGSWAGYIFASYTITNVIEKYEKKVRGDVKNDTTG